VGVVSATLPRIEVQIGILRVGALLDSRSIRSLISYKQFQDLRRVNAKLQLCNTQVNCVTVSGQSLEILGETKVPLKVQGFSWMWMFLVSKKLIGDPILGADFIGKTRLVLELANARCYIDFAPHIRIPF
jgi:hypothetical protein